jgi:PTS system beta-glucosides-specific IIC component
MSLSAIALAVRIKSKDKNLQKSALGMFITIFFTGTSEPVLYGICLPYRKAMLFSILSGAVAGLYQGIMGIHCYAYSFPTVFTSLIFQSNTEPGNFVNAIIAGAISFGVAFIGILLTFKDEK